MPNRAINDRIANRTIDYELFKSQTMDDQLPSDNWRYVLDKANRKAILYVMFFHTQSGEPREIPNEPDVLARLAEFYHSDPALTAGPFLALSETTNSGQILTLRMWNISINISPEATKLIVADMPKPDFIYPETTQVA